MRWLSEAEVNKSENQFSVLFPSTSLRERMGVARDTAWESLREPCCINKTHKTVSKTTLNPTTKTNQKTTSVD